MKYSMNYYTKRKRDIKDTYQQVPKILESDSSKWKRNISADYILKEKGNYQFVVPWQMP